MDSKIFHLSTETLRIWTSFTKHNRQKPETGTVTQISFSASTAPYFLMWWIHGKKLVCSLNMAQCLGVYFICGNCYVRCVLLYFTSAELAFAVVCIQIVLISKAKKDCLLSVSVVQKCHSNLLWRILSTDCVFCWGSLWSSRGDSCIFYKQIQNSWEAAIW